MVRQTNQESRPLTERPLGEDEIKLVRKIKWPHRPFEIPMKLFKNGDRLEAKGEYERKWLNELNKSKSEIKEKFNYFNNTLIKDKLSDLINSEKEKYFKDKPKMATRQCSMKVIEALNNLMPNLIGGSADLSGSNNTKTSNSIILNSKNYGGNYIHFGVREHGMASC